MGRFRDEFAGRKITFRIPYVMASTLTVTDGSTGVQFPEAVFLHNVDKPFECHRVIVRVMPFDNADTPAILPPQFVGAVSNLLQILQRYVAIRIRDTSKNEALTKASTIVGNFQTGDAMTWEFQDPYTMVRSEGFEVTCDNNLTNFAITVGGTTVTVGSIRFEVVFEGYLVVIAPASESR
jgi:hypothetical protein